MAYSNSGYQFTKVLATICLAAVLYPVLTAIYNIYFHPLRRFSGPWLWRAYRLPWVISMQKGELHHRLKTFHESYGSIVRIAPDELSFTDPRAWRDIYGNRPGHAIFERNRTWLRKMRPEEPDSIMGSNEDAHTNLRKAFVQAFSEKALKDQSSTIERYVDLLVNQFQKQISRGQGGATVDLVDWFDFLFFDITGDLSFGVSFDCLRNGFAHPWVEVSHSFGKGLALIASIGFYPPFDKVLKYIIPKKARQKMEDHRTMSRERIRQRLAVDTNRPDFITAVLNNNQMKEAPLSMADFETNMAVLIFAGSETTASASCGTLRMLLQNPDKMLILVTEIRNNFDQEKDIQVTSVNKLKYLNAVINEGLRLCPPVGVGVPRVTPASGEIVCDRLIAGGTYVTLNQYPAFRSASNFNRPDAFIPERFMDSPDVKAGDEAVFQPFQSGRHSCIGQKLALAEMRLLIARLLFAFDIELADRTDVWDWGSQKTFIFWEKLPLKVILRQAQ